MSSNNVFTFSGGTLKLKLMAASGILDRAVGELMKFEASKVQSRARKDAPWRDQTGNARNGLFAKADKEGDTHLIRLYHTVPYGIYLEVSRGGRYAVIMPTIEKSMPEVLQDAGKLMKALGA